MNANGKDVTKLSAARARRRRLRDRAMETADRSSLVARRRQARRGLRHDWVAGAHSPCTARQAHRAVRNRACRQRVRFQPPPPPGVDDARARRYARRTPMCAAGAAFCALETSTCRSVVDARGCSTSSSHLAERRVSQRVADSDPSRPAASSIFSGRAARIQLGQFSGWHLGPAAVTLGLLHFFERAGCCRLEARRHGFDVAAPAWLVTSRRLYIYRETSSLFAGRPRAATVNAEHVHTLWVRARTKLGRNRGKQLARRQDRVSSASMPRRGARRRHGALGAGAAAITAPSRSPSEPLRTARAPWSVRCTRRRSR